MKRIFFVNHNLYIYKRLIYDVSLGWKFKMKPINVDKLFNRKAIINEFEYSLNVNDQIKT